MNLERLTSESDRQRAIATEAANEAAQVEKEIADAQLDEALGEVKGSSKRLAGLENRRAAARLRGERATLASQAAVARAEELCVAEAAEQRKAQIEGLAKLRAQREKIASDLDSTVVELREQLEALGANANEIRETLKELGGEWRDVRENLRSQMLNRISHELRPAFKGVAGFPPGPEVPSLRDAVRISFERMTLDIDGEGGALGD